MLKPFLQIVEAIYCHTLCFWTVVRSHMGIYLQDDWNDWNSCQVCAFRSGWSGSVGNIALRVAIFCSKQEIGFVIMLMEEILH